MSVSKGDKLFGCWLIFCAGLGLAWLGFMGWLLYNLAGWVVTK